MATPTNNISTPVKIATTTPTEHPNDRTNSKPTTPARADSPCSHHNSSASKLSPDPSSTSTTQKIDHLIADIHQAREKLHRLLQERDEIVASAEAVVAELQGGEEEGGGKEGDEEEEQGQTTEERGQIEGQDAADQWKDRNTHEGDQEEETEEDGENEKHRDDRKEEDRNDDKEEHADE